VLFAAGTLFYLPHLVEPLRTYGSLDWRYFHYLFEAGRTSILEHGQFPGWSPWTCGGVPLHAAPQTPFLSPFYLLVLLFGTVLGMKLYVLGHILTGLAGGWYLARTLGYRGAATLFLPIAFVLGTRFTWIIQGGQFTMLTFLFLPWILAFFIRSLRDMRYAVAGAAFFALTIVEGGTYGAPMGAFFLGCYALYRFVEGGFAWRAPASLAVILLVGVLLAAPKLIPMFGFWLDHPRTLPPTDDALGLMDVLKMFFSRRASEYMVDRATDPHLKYAWWGEYGAWIGPITVLLALCAFVLRTRRNLGWLLVGLASGTVMLGSLGNLSPWELLRGLPLFDSLRVPSRYSMLLTLAFAIAASGLLDELGRRLAARSREGKRGFPVWVPLLLCALTAADLVAFSWQVLWSIKHRSVPEVTRQAEFTKESTARHSYETYVRMNRGTLSCRNELLMSSKTRLPLKRLRRMSEEAEIHAPLGAAFNLSSWSPNRMDLSFTSPAKAEVVFRTNYDPNWTSDAGALKNKAGLLALDLRKGDHEVSIRYSSELLVDGLAVFAAVLAIILIIALRRSRSRRVVGPGATTSGADPPGPGRYSLLIILGLAFLYIYPFPFFERLHNPSEDSRILMSRAIVDHDSFVVDKAMGNGYGSNGDLARRDGKHYSCKAPGTSYLGVPVLFGARLAGVESKRGETHLLRLFLSILPSIVFLFLFGRFLRRFVPDQRAWILVMAGLGAGTMHLTYGMLLYGHQQAAISLFGAFMAFYYNRSRKGDSILLLAGGGALVGLAVACEYQSVFSAAVVGVYGIAATHRRIRMLWIIAGGIPPVALMLLYHYVAFGSVFSSGMDFLVNRTYRAYQDHGYKGLFVFSWSGVWGTLFSPRNGLFFFSPWLLLAIPGLYAMARRPDMRREALCVGLAALAYVVFVSGMYAWKGGWSVGPRYVGAAIPFMAFSAALFTGTRAGRSTTGRILLTALVVPSVLFYSLSSAVFPHFPEKIINPFFEFLLPLVNDGHVPWTLAGLAGLGNTMSALPFLLVLATLVTAVLAAGSASPDHGPSFRSRATAVVVILLLSFACLRSMSIPETTDRNTVTRGIDYAEKIWEPR